MLAYYYNANTYSTHAMYCMYTRFYASIYAIANATIHAKEKQEPKRKARIL